MLGGFLRTGQWAAIFKEATSLVVGEFIGDVGSRALRKVIVRTIPNPWINRFAIPIGRVVIGLMAEPLLKMAGMKPAFRRDFSAVNVASGIIGFTSDIRKQLLGGMGLDGLGDFETEEMLGYVDDPALLGHYDDDDAGDAWTDAGVLGEYETEDVLGMDAEYGDY